MFEDLSPAGPPVQPVQWSGSAVRLIDQRRLPQTLAHIECRDSHAVAAAIRDMVVRGAPAIGVTAAYGAVLAVCEAMAGGTLDEQELAQRLQRLAAARPTAVNLAWAISRVREAVARAAVDPFAAAEAAARAVHTQEVAASAAMARRGAALIAPGARVLTHCNTGMLATAAYGSAFGVIAAAHADGRVKEVYASETRPWLQGSRLTAWEFARLGIPCSLVVEGAGAALMRTRGIDWVIVGADRIAANGDVANKIGTYAHAVQARQHGARVMVVAPTSTIDLATASGAAIALEERDGDEMCVVGSTRVAPPEATAWNPVFDVTPAALVDVIVTESMAVEGPGPDCLAAALTAA